MYNAQQLYELYNSVFDIVWADTPELKALAYKTRYEIYCEEALILDAKDYPNRQELDDYDDHSVTSLLIHKRTNEVAGLVRLVLPAQAGEREAFPIQKFYEIPEFEDVSYLNQCCEVTRFCVSKGFRRRLEDGRYGSVLSLQSEFDNALTEYEVVKRAIPYIAAGLLQAVADMAVKNKLLLGYGAVEPRFLRLMKRIGVYFEELSEPIEYLGTRVPIKIDWEELYLKARDAGFPIATILSDNGRIYDDYLKLKEGLSLNGQREAGE